MSQNHPRAEILEKLDSMHASLLQGIAGVERRIIQGENTFQFFSDGLEAFKSRQMNVASAVDFQAAWLARIHADTQLRFPHRKILEFLLRQYDFRARAFSKVHFSRLAREARVGKSRAKAYLSLLIAKGYVEEESDGYRVYYRLRSNPDAPSSGKSASILNRGANE